jgi:hypothetical protein
MASTIASSCTRPRPQQFATIYAHLEPAQALYHLDGSLLMSLLTFPEMTSPARPFSFLDEILCVVRALSAGIVSSAWSRWWDLRQLKSLHFLYCHFLTRFPLTSYPAGALDASFHGTSPHCRPRKLVTMGGDLFNTNASIVCDLARAASKNLRDAHRPQSTEPFLSPSSSPRDRQCILRKVFDMTPPDVVRFSRTLSIAGTDSKETRPHLWVITLLAYRGRRCRGLDLVISRVKMDFIFNRSNIVLDHSRHSDKWEVAFIQIRCTHNGITRL